MTAETSLVPSTCGACGATMTTAASVSFRDGGDEDGTMVLLYTLHIEIIGGCEHAAMVRDEYILRPDPGA